MRIKKKNTQNSLSLKCGETQWQYITELSIKTGNNNINYVNNAE